jgi:hypothetical protein
MRRRFVNIMYYKGDLPEITDGALKLFLNAKELRRLSVLIHGSFVLTHEQIADMEPYMKNYSTHMKKRVNVSKEVLDLYAKANIDNDSAYKHWNIYRNSQLELQHQARQMPANPYQDNKSYHTSTSGGSCYPTVRYPKKKRKTAWKRFYKLFPKLKPEVEPIVK